MANLLSRLVVKQQVTRKHQAIPIPPSARARSTALPAQPRIVTKSVSQSTKVEVKIPQPQTRVDQVVIRQPAPAPNRLSSRLGMQAVVQRPRSPKKEERRSGGVKIVTPDTTSHDQEMVRNVRGRGAGRILVIVGNGPSINEMPLELLRDHPYIDAMSINHPDDRLWPTAYWAFFDSSQQRRHSSLLENYHGTIFNSTSIKRIKNNSVKLKNLGTFGFSLDLNKGFNIGRSSVYAAMQIGLWLDFKHIYILGCDMSEVNGQMHFYGVNPDAQPDVRRERFAKEAEYYADAAGKLDEATRKRFTFCSAYNPYDFVEKFGRLGHREAVAKILEFASTLYK